MLSKVGLKKIGARDAAADMLSSYRSILGFDAAAEQQQSVFKLRSRVLLFVPDRVRRSDVAPRTRERLTDTAFCQERHLSLESSHPLRTEGVSLAD